MYMSSVYQNRHAIATSLLEAEVVMTADPKARAVEAFRRRFGREPELLVRAPGRVNLIGEHVDYNQGCVLPAAIDRAAWIAAATSAGEWVEVEAADLRSAARFRAAEASLEPSLAPWARYPAGVARALADQGLRVSAVNAAIASDVPIGAGLSSSAAVEVAFAAMWKAFGDFDLSGLELARLCQKAENDYVGVNCGLMDQFASVHGRRGHAILFDCRSLASRPVPLPPETVIAVADTRIRRQLAVSEFNLRRAECAEAVRLLARVLPGIESLRDVSPDRLEEHRHALPGVLLQRARHVVCEIARVEAVLPATERGDAAALGAAMIASHRSGRDLYQVSCPELDAMVDAASAIEGCYGARLTGAGFGGCTVNLVARSHAESFRSELARAYQRATGLAADIWICEAADGVEVRTLS